MEDTCRQVCAWCPHTNKLLITQASATSKPCHTSRLTSTLPPLDNVPVVSAKVQQWMPMLFLLRTSWWMATASEGLVCIGSINQRGLGTDTGCKRRQQWRQQQVNNRLTKGRHGFACVCACHLSPNQHHHHHTNLLLLLKTSESNPLNLLTSTAATHSYAPMGMAAKSNGPSLSLRVCVCVDSSTYSQHPRQQHVAVCR